MTIVPALAVAVLFATGTYLILQRTLTRIILGVGLVGNGANLLLIVSAGPAGRPPLIGSGAATDFADPLPQALALTAIVITFGLTAFLLALAYRSWQVTHDDEVEDDVEDRRIARLRDESDADTDELTDELESLEDPRHRARPAPTAPTAPPSPDDVPTPEDRP